LVINYIVYAANITLMFFIMVMKKREILIEDKG